VGLNESVTMMEVPCIDEVLSHAKWTVYHIDVLDNLTKSRIDNFHAICSVLVSAGVRDSDIVRANVDSYTDMDLIEFITDRSGGNFKPPVVFMGNEFLGGYPEIYQLYNSGKLRQIIEANSPHTDYTPATTDTSIAVPQILPDYIHVPATNEPPLAPTYDNPTLTNLEIPKPQLTTLDTALEVVETVVDYLNPMSYWRSFYSLPKPKPIANTNTHIEFDLIHTNWYGRNQRRKFRFCEQELLRIHPSGLIRATHKYNEITKIHKLDPMHLVIYYSTMGTSPDWIGGSDHELAAIIDILQKKNITLKVDT